MSNNYIEETKPLFKMLRTEAFRFIIVRYNHFSLVQELQNDIKNRFPDRPCLKIDAQQCDYQSITQTYFSINRGFLFVENFDDVLKEQYDSQNKETPDYKIANERRRGITAGLNLRRDKLAKYPIALFVFVPASTGELYAKIIMEKMPDLWSFRSMILDLEKEVTNTLELPSIRNDIFKPDIYSEDDTELKRLLEILNSSPENEIAYRLTLYPQIFKEASDTGKYELAFSILDIWENQVTDETEKAWVWIQKGDMLRTHGKLEEALILFNKVVSIANIANTKDKNTLALSLERLGTLYSDLGNLDKALEFFKQCNQLENELFTDNPNNTILKNNLAISYSKLGDMHTDLGNLDKAIEFFKQSNQLENELYAAYPNNVDFKRGLAVSYERLGETYTTLGNLDKALDLFEKETKLFEELYTTYPNNVKFKNGLAISYEKLGKTHTDLGNLDKALDLFERYNQLENELYAAYPNNVSFKNGLAISYEKLGDTYTALGNLDKALNFFEQYNQLENELYTAYPNNVSFKNGLAITYWKLGELYKKLKKNELMLESYKKSSQLCNELFSSYPQNVEFKNNLAESYLSLGRCFTNSDKLTANSYFQQAEVLWQELVKDAPQYVQFQQFLELVQADIKAF